MGRCGLLPESSVEVVLEALGRLLLESGHYLLIGALAGYHGGHRDGGELLNVGARPAHSLEWNGADAAGLGVARPH